MQLECVQRDRMSRDEPAYDRVWRGGRDMLIRPRSIGREAGVRDVFAARATLIGRDVKDGS